MALVKKMRRVAVVGAGPAGAIAVDALAREETFDVIRVFERREDCGGCWSVVTLVSSIRSRLSCQCVHDPDHERR